METDANILTLEADEINIVYYVEKVEAKKTEESPNPFSAEIVQAPSVA